MAKTGPQNPRPCDICGAAIAPFGYAPHGGRKALRPGQRPLMACADPACRALAEDRKAQADAGPLPPKPRRAAPQAPAAPAPQPSLFD
jgi:hypothetical protein